MSDSPHNSTSPAHLDAQIDSRATHRHARPQDHAPEWSTSLDSILDEYAEDYAGNEHSPTGESTLRFSCGLH